MNLSDSIKLELIKAGLVCLTLLLTWVAGRGIINYWDIKKKRQELDIAIAREFHRLYGEFKELSRLWRAFIYVGPSVNPLVFPNRKNTRIDLLNRATASEGVVEAIVLKLATERRLEDDDIITLGLFRQEYQQLRKAIRNGIPFESTYGTPEYGRFNELSSKMTCIISSEKTRMCSKEDAPKIMEGITAARSAAGRRIKKFIDFGG